MTKEEFAAREAAAELKFEQDALAAETATPPPPETDGAKKPEPTHEQPASTSNQRRAGPSQKRARSPSPPPEDPFWRPSFTVDSFLPLPFAGRSDAERWFKEFPVLAKRNFYLIQNHHATAKHWDLRVQLDGKTVSWAIPKGLSDLPTKATASDRGTRLAIETQPHMINYSLFEGGGIGTTAVWDLGSYRILPTQNELKRKAKREKSRADADSDGSATDEDDNSRTPEDWRQEDLFREKLAYASFKAVPAMWGRPGRPPQKLYDKPGHERRAFIIELTGKRFQNLRLRFSRNSSDFKMWLIEPASHPNLNPPTEAPLGPKSILTGRTMDEIKACRTTEQLGSADELEACESQWESADWAGEDLGLERKAVDLSMTDWGADWTSDEEGERGVAGPAKGIMMWPDGDGGDGWEEYDPVAWCCANAKLQ